VVVSRTRACAGTCKVIPICITFKASVESNLFPNLSLFSFLHNLPGKRARDFCEYRQIITLDSVHWYTVLPNKIVHSACTGTYFYQFYHGQSESALKCGCAHNSAYLGPAGLYTEYSYSMASGEGEDACDRIPRSERSKFEGELIQSRNLDLNWVWSRRIN
jgi:hypothetical protein